MFSIGTTDRLVQLFERELRAIDRRPADLPSLRTPVGVSRDLQQQIAQFAGDVRTHGHTAEQMLVELKRVLATVALDIPSTERMTLVSELTTHAIDAYYRH